MPFPIVHFLEPKNEREHTDGEHEAFKDRRASTDDERANVGGDDDGDGKHEVEQKPCSLRRRRLERSELPPHHRYRPVAKHFAGLHRSTLGGAHGTELGNDAERDEQHHENSEIGIEVERDATEKQRAGIVLGTNEPHEVRRPPTERHQQDEWRRRRVGDIRQLFSRDAVLIGQIPHHRPHEERAEIIAEEDE